MLIDQEQALRDLDSAITEIESGKIDLAYIAAARVAFLRPLRAYAGLPDLDQDVEVSWIIQKILDDSPPAARRNAAILVIRALPIRALFGDNASDNHLPRDRRRIGSSDACPRH